MGDLVFAFGSLAATAGGRPAALRGLRRCWGVAMDNRVVIPGYKVWVDPRTGERPPVHVAFLDLEEVEEGEETGAGGAVSGVLLAAPGPAGLAALDRRERNYLRQEVTERVRRDVPEGIAAGAGEPGEPSAGRVWAYLGRADARARCASARRTGTAVVARSYLDGVRAAFAARGAAALAAYEASTAAPDMPLVDLERIDVPPR